MMEERVRTCDCEQDGFCERYQRDMVGRFREICAGVSVDLGTAAAFRAQWSREAAPVPVTAQGGGPTPLILRTDQQPGDAVVATALVHSLHRAHPGKYLTAVESPWPEVFAFNPDVTPTDSLLAGVAAVHLHYPAIHECNDRGIHFMQAWCSHLEEALGVSVPLLTDRPRLYFRDPSPPVEDFWLVCSGGKRDFTNKLWGHHNYQEVISSLKGRVRFVQVGGADDDHPRLSGAEDMVGRTTLRGLFAAVRRARGVLCGVSLLMHIAAALEKPAVVIAGGREPVQWNAYPKQQYCHTIGALPCRSVQGHVGRACWRSRVITLGDGSAHDINVCERPVTGLSRAPTPACMALISPASVAELVLRYNMVSS